MGVRSRKGGVLNAKQEMKNAKTPVFALVDCNNFFVSCERVFRPDLKTEPVAVLSNNDGVIVARSNEVKAMGVPMATPHFKVKDVLEKQGTKLFSANFALYGDFSRRIVEILEAEAPYVEVYSVDESFLEVSSLLIEDYQKWGQDLAAKVEKWTGIPVSVGVGSSKTLAKAASEYAKKHPETLSAYNVSRMLPLKQGVVNDLAVQGATLETTDVGCYEKCLKWLPVEDVWGIGRALGLKLRERGVKTAYDLIQVSEDWVLETMTIRGLKTVRELKGESNIPLESEHKNSQQKSISSTRSFGKTVRTPYELESAVASFAAKIAASLRRKDQVASELVVFLRSGLKASNQHNPSINVKLPFATSDTALLTAVAVEGLDKIIKQGHGYKKAGIVVYKLLPAASAQLPLVNTPSEEKMQKSDKLMQVLDDINKRWGKGSLLTARESSSRADWKSRQEKKSPAYTTSWVEIPVIK